MNEHILAPHCAGKVIGEFAERYLTEREECLRDFDFRDAGHLLDAFKDLAPNQTDIVHHNFCYLDYEKPCPGRDYFGHEIAHSFLDDLCTFIKKYGSQELRSCCGFMLPRGFVALCQLILTYSSGMSERMDTFDIDSGLPKTLVLARAVTFPGRSQSDLAYPSP